MLSLYRSAATVIVMTLLFSVPATAAVITYANQASFLAAVGTTITDDYSNPGYLRSNGPMPAFMTDAFMSGVLNETKYKSTLIPNINEVVGPASGGNPFYCTGCNASFDLNFQTTSLSTGGGLFGASFNYRNGGLLGGSGVFDFLVNFADGTSTDYLIPLTVLGGQTPDFFGITATQKIKDIYFGLNGKPGLGPIFQLDNLTIAGAVTAVPEPLTLGMFGAGLAGIAMARRRRKS